MTNPLPLATRRLMIRDSVLSTVEDFLSDWLGTIAEHHALFPRLSQYEGNALLAYVRDTLRDMENEPQAVAKPGKAPTVYGTVLDEKGAKVERKGFASHYEAQKWTARKVADLPGYSGLVDGRPMTRDQAIALAWGGRQPASPVTAKAPRGDGPWQKAQQTRVVLPKR